MKNKAIYITLILFIIFQYFQPLFFTNEMMAESSCSADADCVFPHRDSSLNASGYNEDGIDSELFIGYIPNTEKEEMLSFVQFELTSDQVPISQIDRVELQLYVKTVEPESASGFKVTGIHEDDFWPSPTDSSAEDLTSSFDKQPLVTNLTVSDNEWVTLDVTDYMKEELQNGNEYATFMLEGSSLDETNYFVIEDISKGEGNIQGANGSRLAFFYEKDKNPPTGKITINHGEDATNNKEVTLDITSNDDFGPVEMRFSNDNLNWGEWEPVADSKEWLLADGNGEKTVYMNLRDANGNQTVESDTIKVDTSPPAVTGVSDQSTYDHDVTITFNEGAATLNGMQFINGDTVSDIGDYTLVVKDDAGNETSTTFTIEKSRSVADRGSGTSDDPYIIETANHLNEVRNYLNDPDVHFELANDIDLSTFSNLKPIGDADNPFSGHLDENGHTISNVKIVHDYDGLFSTNEAGLFGVSDGTIQDVHLANVNVIGSRNVGGLVGKNKGNIKDVSVESVVSGDSRLGGIAGTSSGSIEASYVEVKIAQGMNIGGITGVLDGGGIKESYALGHVKAPYDIGNVGGLVGTNLGGEVNQSFANVAVEGAYYIGGLIGKNSGAVRQSYAVGNVDGKQQYIGGLIGSNNGTVGHSYSVGNVSYNEHKPEYKGGLIGINEAGSSSITDSFWDINRSGLEGSNGGIGKTTEQFADANLFLDAGWDPNVWSFSAGQYPKLLAIAYDDTFDVMSPLKPIVNINGGTFSEPQTISLEGEEYATFYYTLDGTKPTMESSEYKNDILIEIPTSLRAIQVDQAGNESPILEERYDFAYEVTFNSNGSTIIDTQMVVYNDLVSEPEAPERTGYTFAGWYTDESYETAWNFEEDVVTEDTKLYAKWEINNYEVSFETNGGSAVSQQSVPYQEKVSEPEAPERTGYTFAGWYTDETYETVWDFEEDVVTEDTTLYAKWKISNYEVSFETNGGSAVSQQSVPYQKK
ncbi:InlB B-repeat-containing protein, partial [Gracilibacillus suaedae]|uniref:InlB B-repeat-containing protein n=1 Tax=Gracilibacillus suaedae TaxID=2820273 RepID=UPI001ABE4B05